MRCTTLTTRRHLLDADEAGEFDLTFEPLDASDPDRCRVTIEGTRATVSYLVRDDDPSDYEWGDIEFREFASGAERDAWRLANLHTCADCGLPVEDHDDATRAGAADGGYDEACDEFRPVTEWTPHMFWVERYEHGLVRYAPTGESSAVDRQWDVAPGVAILTLPDDIVGEPIDVARSVLDNYTSWCNGDVFGLVHEFFERAEAGAWVADGDESCWGYIGAEYAERTLAEEHASYELHDGSITADDVAVTLNRMAGAGGFLVWRRVGSRYMGGEFHTTGSRPRLAESERAIAVPWPTQRLGADDIAAHWGELELED